VTGPSPLLRQVLELLPDPALLRRRDDDVIVVANPAFAEMVGAEPDELAGRSLDEVGLAFRGPERDEFVRRLDDRGRVENVPMSARVDGDPDREIVHLVSSRLVDLDGRTCVLSVSKDVTQRQRAEEELRASRERYRGLFRLSRDGVFVADATGTILEVNQRAAEMVGRDPDDLVGSSVLDLHPPEGREAARRALERTVEEGGGQFDLPFRRPDGGEWLGQVVTSVVEVEDPPFFQAVVRDVTDRAEARREIERQKEMLSRILGTTTEGILLADRDGTFRYANPAAEEMLGLETSDIADRTYDDPRWEIRGPDGGPFPAEDLPVARVLEEGRAVEGIEHRVVRPDGGDIVLSVNAAPITESPDGGEGEERARGVVASIRDVTVERRRAERLRQSERRYRELFENNVAGAFRSTPDGEILDCNQALAEIFGYDDPEELEGEDALRLYDSDVDRARYQRRLREQGRLVNEELRLRRRDGSVVWVLENSSLTEDPETGETVNQGTLVDITDRKRSEERLEEMAYRDPLTGLGNRRLLEEQADQILSLAERQGRYVGLVYFDLDRFQSVNDRWGHGTGDEVLRRVGERLDDESRETDLLARMGGDEFVLLLADLDAPEEALTTTRRITAAFDAPFRVRDREIPLGASAGVAVFPDDGEDLEALLRQADRALYRADQSDGGLARYSPEIDLSLSDDTGFDRRIRRALERDELVLHYQPILRLADGRPHAAEALVRWNHPEKGLLAAGEFVPRAERTGVIRAVDAHVVEQAVDQLARWQRKGTGPATVALNLSAASFRDPGVVRRVSRALKAAEPPDRSGLVIEITEAEAMEDPAVAGELLRGFREIGVRVALDDFGTGHSSLSYLDQFPVDLIKLDRRFISKLDPDEGDTRLVEAMLELARSLDLATVAEAVETEGQRRWLAESGTDLAQGFLFARAMPPEEVEAYWREGASTREPSSA
jgi:diguanylate cyclase (GGDEF)-like protein/PAS domain S-box-containing protein